MKTTNMLAMFHNIFIFLILLIDTERTSMACERLDNNKDI